MLAGHAFAQGRVVYLVPNGFPGSDNIHVVEDGNDERFCRLGLRGLDLARQQLGYSPCNTAGPRTEAVLALAERFHEVEALILVDDRSQLSPEATQLLSGAIQQRFGTNYYVVPFAMELSQARSTAVPAGFKAVVVGERLYRDHYSSLPTGDLIWTGMLRSGIRTISSPEETLPRGEIDAEIAAREVYARANAHYTAGEYERAYWLFYDISRIPGFDRPLITVNVALARAAQAAVAYLEGDYERAADLWTMFSSDALRVNDEVPAERLREDDAAPYRAVRDRVDVWIADALLRAGERELAERLFSTETLILAQSARTRDELLRAIPTLQNRYGPPQASGVTPITDEHRVATEPAHARAGPVGSPVTGRRAST